MPEPLKIYNTFRMRAFGYWLGRQGIPVINNVRWGTPETYWYAFDGIPTHSIVAIGTVASGLRNKANRNIIEVGLRQMVRKLSPTCIIVYGSTHYTILDALQKKGIRVITFKSRTAEAFERRNCHV